MGGPMIKGTLALLCAVATRAAAQTPADSIGWHFVGNLGYVQTSGNTKLSTVNIGDKATWRASTAWSFTQTVAWVYGKSAGVESANQLLGGVRADYWINSRLSAFGSADYEANPYAGISHRMQELAGLSFKAIARPRQTLSVDVGAGVTQERTAGISTSYGI